jgi:hypothetical protein
VTKLSVSCAFVRTPLQGSFGGIVNYGVPDTWRVASKATVARAPEVRDRGTFLNTIYLLIQNIDST